MAASSASGIRELAKLVRDAQAGTPQLLRRRYTAVAAMMTAERVIRVHPGEHLDVDEPLRAGATINLTYNPGTPPDNNPDSPEPDEPDVVVAAGVDPSGGEIGTGTGDTAAEALAMLHRRLTEPPVEYSQSPF